VKIVKRQMYWTDNDTWAWPEGDSQLLAVFDQVNDIDRIVKHVRKFDLCIQAGGAAGIWARRFGQLFGTVITFEPNPLCYECLMINAPSGSVLKCNAALAAASGFCEMAIPEGHANNLGAWYTVNGRGSIPTVALDSLSLGCCDLIQLDIEGGELAALTGAFRTIEKFSPVIVLEQKALPHLPVPDAGPYLKRAHNYRLAERIGNDDVFVPC